MKEQDIRKGKNDTSSEMVSWVPSGEILTFMENTLDIILLNPFFVTGLFLWPFQTSEIETQIKRDHWDEIG